ncbi:MAG: hypothetical protein ACKO8O_01155 [Betaproteobacteria bacterium]
MSVVWKDRLAAQAELDFSEIITWYDIGPGISTLHVARQGISGRHFVVFSGAKDQ